MSHHRHSFGVSSPVATAWAAVAVSLGVAGAAHAQSVGPEFAANYTLTDLGSAPGVVPNYGGLTLRQSEANTLYLGGAANGGNGAVYRVALERDGSGAIVSWGCSATELASTAPGIDGGLCFGPEGVLAFTTFTGNQIGQILPGQATPAKYINLTALGIAASTGSLMFVPEGFAGAGRLKVVSYNAGFWYDTTTQPAGDGTFNIVSVSPLINIGGGPEGVVYVKGGNPGFTADSVLVSEYATGRVSAYEIDGNGDPIVSTRRDFITGLSGAEGAAIDPLTGDFLFSTFGGGSRVIRVTGFTITDTCIGDIDGSGVIDGADLGLLLSAWGDCPECPEDLNGDCVVNGVDLGVLLSGWGPCL